MVVNIFKRRMPTRVINDTQSGYAINVPAEWQTPVGWWRNRELAENIIEVRKQIGVILHDALWAWLNDDNEPDSQADSYHFDPVTETYTRSDVRL